MQFFKIPPQTFEWTGLLLSTALIQRRTTFFWLWALRLCITHWSIGWRTDVVFGGRKIRLMFVSSLIFGWEAQFSITSTTFLLWARKNESSFLIHSSNKTPVIQLFFCALSVSERKLLYIFKAPWLFGLAIHKHFQLFPSCTSGRHACQSYFTVPEHLSPDRW